MDSQIVAYLIGLIPAFTGVCTAAVAAFKLVVWIKKMVSKQKTVEDTTKEIENKINDLLAENAAIRRENVETKKLVNKLLTKIDHIHRPEVE